LSKTEQGNVQVIKLANPSKFAIGLDLGKKLDFGCLAVAAYYPDKCVLMEIQRIEQGTMYQDLADFVIDYIKTLTSKAKIDLGQPFIFTGGAKGTKVQLINKMRTLYETSRLKFLYPMYNDFAKREINALIDEMRAYEDRRVGTPSEALGVFESGKHDDMVSACALAVQDYLMMMGGAEAYMAFLPDNTWVTTPLGSAKENADEFMGSVITFS